MGKWGCQKWTLRQLHIDCQHKGHQIQYLYCTYKISLVTHCMHVHVHASVSHSLETTPLSRLCPTHLNSMRENLYVPTLYLRTNLHMPL